MLLISHAAKHHAYSKNGAFYNKTWIFAPFSFGCSGNDGHINQSCVMIMTAAENNELFNPVE
jgi:hypothetical protein